MTKARIVQWQDGAVPPAQTTVRFRSPRSNGHGYTPIDIKSLVVRPVPPGVVKPLIIEHHYLHCMPSACWKCFGVYLGEGLVGAALFTAGPRHGHRVLLGAKPQQVAVLARLWLADDLPKNAESRVLGVLIRSARRHPLWKMLLSYADPAAGHSGIIYRASGWLYLGRGQPSRYLDLGDGHLIHPRTAYDRLGANSLGHLLRTGTNARNVMQAGKHRFVYILDPAWRWRLRDPVVPYPAKGNTP